MRRRYLWIVALCGVMFGVLGSVGWGATVSVLDQLTADGEGVLTKTNEGVELRTKTGGEGKAFTKNEFKTPLMITAVCKTDSQNLRLYYAQGMAIFNWEGNEDELRFHDPKTHEGKGFAHGGQIPKNTWVTVKWIIDSAGTSISVNGVVRGVFQGDYSKISAKVRDRHVSEVRGDGAVVDGDVTATSFRAVGAEFATGGGHGGRRFWAGGRGGFDIAAAGGE